MKLSLGWVVGGVALAALGWEAWRRWTVASTPAGASASAAPGAPGAPRQSLENPPMLLGENGPMRLAKGQRYRMRYSSTLLPSVALVRSLFGLVKLKFYVSPAELPSDWPKALATGDDPATRWAVGTWMGETSQVAKPPGLWQLWPTGSDA